MKSKQAQKADSSVRDRVAGVDYEVRFRPDDKDPGVPINFDNAATTPAFKSVLTAINEEMNTYAAIGRSKGAKSTITTDRYELYRKTVLHYFNALEGRRGEGETKYAVSYVNATTDGLNRLAAMLVRDSGDIVVTTRMEHHANDLPWRSRATVLHAEVDSHGALDTDELLRLLVENAGKVKVVSVTAASNVTGLVNDVHWIARQAHQYGAKIVVDCAQIAGHKPFSLYGQTPEEDIDFIVFSAHKLYAPFGGGAIVGVKDDLAMLPPAWHGGGNVSLVADETERLLGPPDRHEAGSPNYFGVVAMHQAMEEILSEEVGGFDYVVKHEVGLLDKVVEEMRNMPEIILYNFCSDPECEWCKIENYPEKRVGVVAFNVRGRSSKTVAKDLADRGVALREGAFCAHPYVARLMKVSDAEMLRAGGPSRMLRLSFGIYNTEKEVDDFLTALRDVISGPVVDRVGKAVGDEMAADWSAPTKNLSRGAS